MLKLLLFCAVLVLLSRTSETSQIVSCKMLSSGIFCLPGYEASPDFLKALMDFNVCGFPRFTMQTRNREMKTQVEDQKIKKAKDSRIRIIKRTSTIKDSRIRIIKRTSTIKDSRIRMLKRTSTNKDSRIRILKRTSTIKDSRIRILKRANRIKDSRIRIQWLLQDSAHN